jgi:DNA-binding FadR family transcriptional regulator
MVVLVVESREARVTERATVPQQTARAMMREALRRGLVPGDRLAAEPTLMSYFGVSRGSLRETLRVLSFLGAIEVRSGPGGGARIAMPQPRVIGSALAMALQFRGATLRTVLEARAAMEPAMAGLAAAHRKDQDLAALDACLQRLDRAAGTEAFQHENDRFHHLLAVAAGNEVLTLIVPALTWITTAVARDREPDIDPRSIADKSRIAAAVRARDATAAREATIAMFDRVLADLDQHQPRQLAAQVIWPDVDELLDTDEERDQRAWTR